MTELGTIEVVEVFRVAGRLMLKARLVDCSEVRMGDKLGHRQWSYVVKAVSFIPAETWASGIRLLAVNGGPEPEVGERLKLSR